MCFCKSCTVCELSTYGQQIAAALIEKTGQGPFPPDFGREDEIEFKGYKFVTSVESKPDKCEAMVKCVVRDAVGHEVNAMRVLVAEILHYLACEWLSGDVWELVVEEKFKPQRHVADDCFTTLTAKLVELA